MKKKTILVLLILIMFASSFSASCQKPGISGEWKINKEKTVFGDSQLFLSRVSIVLKSDSLLTKRVYENINGEEYSFEENLSLNSKECNIVVYDMPRTTKALKSNTDESFIIESVTIINGENYSSKETWKVDSEAKILTIDFINKMSGVETIGKSYFSKVN